MVKMKQLSNKQTIGLLFFLSILSAIGVDITTDQLDKTYDPEVAFYNITEDVYFCPVLLNLKLIKCDNLSRYGVLFGKCNNAVNLETNVSLGNKICLKTINGTRTYANWTNVIDDRILKETEPETNHTQELQGAIIYIIGEVPSTDPIEIRNVIAKLKKDADLSTNNFKYVKGEENLCAVENNILSRKCYNFESRRISIDGVYFN